MESDQQEEAPAAFKESASWRDEVVLASDFISLLSDDMSMTIPSQHEECQAVTVQNFKKDRFSWLAETNLRHTCKKFKQEIVEYMAAEILDFFIQPEEHCIKKERCSVEHVQYLLYKLVRISFTFTIEKNPSTPEAIDAVFTLHQDFLPEKNDVVKELEETLSWTGVDHVEKMRKDEELKLIRRAHRANKHRTITERQRLKFRAYFV
ncbi:hypothetical protein MKW98_026146 [Papaver atlanticum]|uniref:Uncharacterized protein n=1 Tax=Papaver atlanticum TaxID=357466 RepID=A0AAD4X4M2_9MAGN|nr:hypothetical protein MKW98_026146 [Papaver atlanticum]